MSQFFGDKAGSMDIQPAVVFWSSPLLHKGRSPFLFTCVYLPWRRGYVQDVAFTRNWSLNAIPIGDFGMAQEIV